MTQEILAGKDAREFQGRGEATCLKIEKNDVPSEIMLHFQKQQTVNLQVKERLAQELAEMELPESVAYQILHIEAF